MDKHQTAELIERARSQREWTGRVMESARDAVAEAERLRAEVAASLRLCRRLRATAKRMRAVRGCLPPPL